MLKEKIVALPTEVSVLKRILQNHCSMKKCILFLFLPVFNVLVLQSQSFYEHVNFQTQPSTTGKTYIHKKNVFRFDTSPGTGKWIFHFGDTGGHDFFHFEIPNAVEDVNPEFFIATNPKELIFVLVPVGQLFNEGCFVFACKEGTSAKLVGMLNVAEYGKNKEGYMDYNNIAMRTTIVKINQRWVFSFETPLIVLKPGGAEEEILKGNAIFYQYSREGWEMKRN